VYLLGPKGSLFRPLKLPKSTISAKGCFLTFGQFSIYNGDNEQPAFYLQTFLAPFCHFLDLFAIFSSLKIVYYGS
jgi:hypothetical protein